MWFPLIAIINQNTNQVGNAQDYVIQVGADLVLTKVEYSQDYGYEIGANLALTKVELAQDYVIQVGSQVLQPLIFVNATDLAFETGARLVESIPMGLAQDYDYEVGR